MLKRYSLAGVLVLVFLGLLASCGGSSGTTDGDNVADGSASAQEVVANLSAGAGQLEEMNSALNNTGLVFAPSFFGAGEVAPLDTDYWSCSNEQVTGDATDADNDGIPVNATYVADCSISGSTGSLTWHINLTAVDGNDGDPRGGYAINGKVAWVYDSAGENSSWTWNITRHNLTKTATGYDFVYEGSWVSSSTASDEGDMTLSYNLNGSWTPADPNATTGYWTNGTLNVDGTYGLATAEYNYDIEYTIDNMVMADTCSDGIQSGSIWISIDLGGDDSITCVYQAHWDGCEIVVDENCGG
ncbi:hypothetical protein [Oceanithermus sp.]